MFTLQNEWQKKSRSLIIFCAMLIAKYEHTYLKKKQPNHQWRAIFEVTLHFERENYKLSFPMKYKQPFKLIPCKTLFCMCIRELSVKRFNNRSNLPFKPMFELAHHSKRMIGIQHLEPKLGSGANYTDHPILVHGIHIPETCTILPIAKISEGWKLNTKK